MWSFLTSVATEIEADILLGLLDQEKIPVRKVYPGIGNLKATYGLLNGVELYVPESQLQLAKILLNSISSEQINTEEKE
jgi:hypothetical protein